MTTNLNDTTIRKYGAFAIANSDRDIAYNELMRACQAYQNNPTQDGYKAILKAKENISEIEAGYREAHSLLLDHVCQKMRV